MDKLHRAADYIKSGQKKEGGQLLIELLREQPDNEQAWLWLAAAVKGREKKLECLEKVLTINPENEQARKLLAKLEEKKSEQVEEDPLPPAFGEPEQKETEQPADQPERQQTAQVSPFTEEPESEGDNLAEPEPEHEPYQPPTYLDQPEGELPEEGPEPDFKQGEPPEERSFGELARAWTRFFKMSGDFFDQEQKYANGGDTLLSVLVHTIVTVLIVLVTGFLQFRALSAALQAELPGSSQVPNLGTFFVGLLVGAAVLTPISFYLNAGMQFLGSRLFGGEGTYGEQAYLQALIQVPATVLGGLFSLGAVFPAAGCILAPLGLLLGIWTLILNVRAMKSVHGLGTGGAVAAIIVPPLLLTFLFGCILFATGSVIGSIFQQMINQGMNLP